MQAVAHIGTQDKWYERRHIVLGKSRVSYKLDELILGAKQNEISLAVFKPAKVIDFIVEREESREWDPKKLS
ncbi:MAG: hypothetical protein ACK5R2_01770, partial [Cyanobacteriota bacterium]